MRNVICILALLIVSSISRAQTVTFITSDARQSSTGIGSQLNLTIGSFSAPTGSFLIIACAVRGGAVISVSDNHGQAYPATSTASNGTLNTFLLAGPVSTPLVAGDVLMLNLTGSATVAVTLVEDYSAQPTGSISSTAGFGFGVSASAPNIAAVGSLAVGVVAMDAPSSEWFTPFLWYSSIAAEGIGTGKGAVSLYLLSLPNPNTSQLTVGGTLQKKHSWDVISAVYQ